MSSPKGYPSQEKEARLKAEHVTITPKGPLQHGLDVIAHSFKRVKAADAVEAGSTTTVINATAHVALKGDVIRFTSGALIFMEATVYAVTANTIELAEKLPSAPAAAVTFDIMRYASPTLNASGEIITVGGGGSAGVISFTLDGLSQDVTEDTAVPANNRPLPVKLTGFDGDVSINASNLNLDVQLTAVGADADSVRIGDGTDTLAINGDGSINIALPADAATESTLATLATEATLQDVETGIGAVINNTADTVTAVDAVTTELSDKATEVTLAALEAKFGALGQANMAGSAPVVLASDQTAIPVIQATSSAMVFQARGKIVGASLTGTYATLLTAAGSLRVIELFNSCDQPIMISFDNGVTDHFELDAQEQFSIDLAAAGRHIAAATVISAKHAGVTPASGSVRCSAQY